MAPITSPIDDDYYIQQLLKIWCWVNCAFGAVAATHNNATRWTLQPKRVLAARERDVAPFAEITELHKFTLLRYRHRTKPRLFTSCFYVLPMVLLPHVLNTNCQVHVFSMRWFLHPRSL
jgi:hypothetical protein